MNKGKSIDILAPREKQVFFYLLNGVKTKEIANQLSLKANTISTIKKVVYKKLELNSSIDLFKFGIENQLIK
jgi:DNA-binding NarL/FixJ family response regulator